MLHIDVESIEAGGMGDVRDLDAADEPHRHGRNHLVARELLLDVVAQNIAWAHLRPPYSLVSLTAVARDLARSMLEWPAMVRLLEAESKSSGYPPYWH